MSRISKIEAKDWDPELRAMTRPDTATALEQGLMRFFAHTPQVAKRCCKRRTLPFHLRRMSW